MKTFKELMDEFVEALKRKVVYRNGKRVVKKVTDKDGLALIADVSKKIVPSEKTSNATPPILFFLIASHKSISETRLPLAVLIIKTLFFIILISLALIIDDPSELGLQ